MDVELRGKEGPIRTLSALAVLLVVSLSYVHGDDKDTKKHIVVKLSEQKLYTYEGTVVKHKFSCVTGKADSPTVSGKFTIFRKEEKYTSKKYGSDMPYSMFFSKDGKAIHAGLCCVEAQSFLRSMFDDLGADRLGSHGCVRLSKEDSKTLFEWAQVGVEVEVQK